MLESIDPQTERWVLAVFSVFDGIPTNDKKEYPMSTVKNRRRGQFGVQMLGLSEITLDMELQPRAIIDAETVKDYAETYLSGDHNIPPVIVYFDGKDYRLADGWHRYHARKRANFEDIEADVRSGGKDEALLFSVGANAEHGVRRTHEDKRLAVIKVLKNAKWCVLTNSAIANYCKVSASFVADIRQRYSSELPNPPNSRITSNGSVYTPSEEPELPLIEPVRPVILPPNTPINPPVLKKHYGDPIFKRMSAGNDDIRRDVETPFGKIDIADGDSLYWFVAFNEPAEFWRKYGACDFMRKHHNPDAMIVLVGVFGRSLNHIIDFARRHELVEFLSPDQLLKG